MWEQDSVTRREVGGVGRVGQSFEIKFSSARVSARARLHELPHVSRYIIVEKFNTMRASVRPDSVIKKQLTLASRAQTLCSISL